MSEQQQVNTVEEPFLGQVFLIDGRLSVKVSRYQVHSNNTSAATIGHEIGEIKWTSPPDAQEVTKVVHLFECSFEEGGVRITSNQRTQYFRPFETLRELLGVLQSEMVMGHVSFEVSSQDLEAFWEKAL